MCVVSDQSLATPFATLERNAALWKAAKDRPGFVLLVVVKPCKLPTLSDHIRRCELFGIPEAAARVRLREFMQKREAPLTTAFPGKVFAVSNIPIRVPEHFLGLRRYCRCPKSSQRSREKHPVSASPETTPKIARKHRKESTPNIAPDGLQRRAPQGIHPRKFP